jgi:hypothetical protein
MRLAVGLILGALVAGCDAFAPPVPDWILNRQPLEACAEGIVDGGGPQATAGERCLLDAYRAGRGAELVMSGAMASGAPMTSYFRVHENGVVEVFRNLGSDPDAPGAWERMRCRSLVPTEGIRDPFEGVFTLEDCEMLPIP